VEYTYTNTCICSAQVSDECVPKFNELKLDKKFKFIIYKLDDNYKEIVVDEASENGDWKVFREKLITAQSKSKTVCLFDAPYGEFGRVGLMHNIGKGWQGTKIRCL
jgi:hypothetical protein